ncbi:hypothetical protein HPB51_002670 [Rhipicephalus microplus]|uniref:YqaJ viral recombinase domain-containing protein n=1 Tax=Rhipicephalus microplus TaxID=6941 RepID=A0A9J6ERE2_RHIMP|nr:hypothetical protein HPB51_002670 [Rhipicephalus microplus]
MVDDHCTGLPKHVEARRMAARPYSFDDVNIQFTEEEVREVIGYGSCNEPMDAQRYEEVLHNMDHGVTVLHCGLLVNLYFPWLGASPDRLVYDPAEGSYGVLEIKFPYNIRDKKGEDLATATLCYEVIDSGPRLKREDYCYAQ